MGGVNRGLKKGIANKRLEQNIICTVHLIQRRFTKTRRAWSTFGNLLHRNRIRTKAISRFATSLHAQEQNGGWGVNFSPL